VDSRSLGLEGGRDCREEAGGVGVGRGDEMDAEERDVESGGVEVDAEVEVDAARKIADELDGPTD
jgi:hypothetical protein